MKVKRGSEVAQLCPTLREPMDCSLPGSSIHGMFQARVLEWGVTAFSGSLPYLHAFMVLPAGVFRQRVVCKEFLQGLIRVGLAPFSSRP